MGPPPSEGNGQAATQRRAACQGEPLVKAIRQLIESADRRWHPLTTV
jgi:hypothetical protein